MRSTGRIQSGAKQNRSRTVRQAALRGVEMLERRLLCANIIVNTTADNAIAGDGMTTLREAIIAANNDSTTDTGQKGSGADDITFNLGGGSHAIDLATALPALGSNLSISGPGDAQDLTVQHTGAADFRIFTVASGRTVTLKNMTIRLGQLTSGDGGGVLNAGGNLTVNNCVITNNSARFGGGVANVAGGTMELIDSAVGANAATNDGGGIDNVGSTATLTRCAVDGNYASGSGGGIANSTNATLTAVDSGVSWNTATDDSGGIDNSSNSSITLKTTGLTGNTAPDTGGAVTNKSGCTLVIDECSFDQNGSAHGGAIFNGGLLDAEDAHFQSNYSSFGAGAIDNNGTETVRRCDFVLNSAAAGGGAMWNHIASTATVIACTFSSNSSGEGGAINNREGATLTIDRSNFINNFAYGLGGGAIWNFFGNVYLTDSTLQYNTGAWDGGAINNNNFLQITGCTFNDNYAPQGGALFNWYTGSMTVESSTVARNGAGNAAGGIMNHGVAELRFVTVADNYPGGAGVGAGITNDGGSLSLSHSVVARSVGGGDLYSNNPNDVSAYSFIGDTDGDPMLAALADNGGPTWTMAPLPGSPLIDAGDPDFTPPPDFDQRGEGFARVMRGRVDIGAFEYNAAPTTSGLPAVTVPEDAPDFSRNLRDSFDDEEDGPAGLAYAIVGNTNPALFAAASIDATTDVLTLDYAADAHGVAQVTIRATDSAGQSVDSTFTVTVLSAQEQADLIKQRVEALPGLNQGNRGSLLVKLNLKGDDSDADKVNSFIAAVGSFAAAGKISGPNAEDLLAAANDLLGSLA